MRHHVKGRTLHRVKRQRVALLRSLARSLVLHEGITTTIAKAKELRPYIERLVSKSKLDSLAARRAVVSEIGDATKKLYGMKDRWSKRSGGYTRIVRLGRVGKRAVESARIEFLK
jgi:large subunit ribosomal protein L17